MLKLMSNTLATWCKKLSHWKRPWCWERLRAGGGGDDRGWDGWMASLTRWTYCAVLSHSVVSNSLRPNGLWPTRLLCLLGILQARILEWVAMPYFMGSSQARDQTQVSCIAGRFFTIWVSREALMDMSSLGSRSWWWTGKPGLLQSMGLQRVGHNWATELNWKCLLFSHRPECSITFKTCCKII